MTGLPRTLSARLALAMTGAVLLATLLSALLTGPLLRSSTEQATRDGLGRQAELLGRLPATALRIDRADLVPADDGQSLGAVTRDGRTLGVASVLTDAQRAELLAGGRVSATVRRAGSTLIVEGRPARSGGAVVLATDASTIRASLDRQRRRVLIALGIGLLTALGAAALVAGRIGRPLSQTADAARRLAAGQRGVRLPESTVSEVRDVTDALGHLDQALRVSEDRQRRFLTSVSHELRTPLTAIRGYAEALADGAVEPAEAGEVGRTLVRESERMERYVADLLALSRLEADDFTVLPAPVDVSTLVRETAGTWRARGETAGVSLRVEAPEAPLVAVTDGGRLRQVLDALVDNAIRVCPEGAVVVLAAERTGIGDTRVEVRDSGPGLTDDDVAVAFEPGTLHRRYAGVRPVGHGLGLPIVARVVTRLGGSVRAGHAPEGGAAFVIDLPDLPPVPAPAPGMH